ncbi:MAG: hypothetical protein ABJ349_06945, partial [Hyphomicrobiales bacterium]
VTSSKCCASHQRGGRSGQKQFLHIVSPVYWNFTSGQDVMMMSGERKAKACANVVVVVTRI